jgi:hypothetical protein
MTSLAVESFSIVVVIPFFWSAQKISSFFAEAYADPLCMDAEQMAYFLCSQAGVCFQLSGVVNGPMTHGHKVQSGGRGCVTCHAVRIAKFEGFGWGVKNKRFYLFLW